MLRFPTPATKARFLLIGYGLILLVWMSLEDSSTLSVALLGTGATIIYLGYAVLQRIASRRFSVSSWIVGNVSISAMFGAIAPIVIAFLMFFKSGWHGHIYPDYPAPMIAAMLTRIPLWTLAGALVGLALGIITVIKANNLQSTSN